MYCGFDNSPYANVGDVCDEAASKPKIYVQFEKDLTKEQKTLKFIENEVELVKHQGPLVNTEELFSVLKSHFGPGEFPKSETQLDKMLKCQKATMKKIREMRRTEMRKQLCLAKDEADKDAAKREARKTAGDAFAQYRYTDDSDDDDFACGESYFPSSLGCP